MYSLDSFSVNHNVIFFPLLVPRKCYQGLSRSRQNYRIILAGYTTTTTTTITLLLFPPCPSPLPSHFYCFSPPRPHRHQISTVFPLHHLHRHRISIREIKTYSSACMVMRFFPQKGGNWCTLYYFPWIPLKLRP